MEQEVVRGRLMAKPILRFYHKFPVLWKFDVLMPDFHISGNTGERGILCDNHFTDEP